MDDLRERKLECLRTRVEAGVLVVDSLSGPELSGAFKFLQEDNPFLMDQNGTCLLPVVGGGGEVTLCGSSSVQGSHEQSRS